MKFTAPIALLAFALVVRGAAADAPAAPPAPPAPPPTAVVVLDHVQVDDAFAKGLPLLVNTRYKIQAGRRVASGSSEIHEQDTDILYVTEGSATCITGGTMVEPKRTDGAPGEIRGTAITGGVTRRVTKGDIIVVPAGIPHQFIDVSQPFLYFVVKVTK